jgi:uncharacterized membrane protein YccC
MPPSHAVRQFLYSQHAFTAFRTLLGVVLPALFVLARGGQVDVAIGLSLGAFCVSLVDAPEPTWRKPLRMLAATLVLGATAAVIALVPPHSPTAWPVLLAIAFCSGLGVAYGVPGTLLGLCALLGMDLMLAQRDAGGGLWNLVRWMMCGGLWYTAFSTAACAFFPQQIARRALGESLTAAALHLRRRADCFISGTPVEECLRRLADAQSAVIDAQQMARDVVLGTVAASRRVSRRQARLFNVLTGAIDIHDASLALHGDFAALRAEYADSDAGRLVCDAVRAAAQQAENLVPRLVLGKTAAYHRTRIDREPLHALQREIHALQACGKDPAPLMAFHAQLAALADTLDRLWRNLDPAVDPDAARDTTAAGGSLQADIDTAVRVFRGRRKWLAPWRAVAATPSALRYALRLTLAIALGVLAAHWIGGHGAWVILTIIVVMSPSFGANQQRSRQRIAGTLMGCAATAALVWLGLRSPWLVTYLIIACFALSFALPRPATYLPSVVFGIIAVLMIYHLLVPGWSMIEQRGLDTLIGGVIGALGAFVLPVWERDGIKARLDAARQACRRYASAAFADDFNMSNYRVSRRDALEAVRALAAARQRMLQEPPAKRHCAARIGDWLLTCDLMFAALASLGQWRRAHGQNALPPACRASAERVDVVLDGKGAASQRGISTAGPPRDPGMDGRPPVGAGSPPAMILDALHSAALSMNRANAALQEENRTAACPQAGAADSA